MNKDYWDGPYYDYLVSRTAEANSSDIDKSNIIKNDIKIPSDKTYEFFVKKMDLKKGSNLLDVGCGFGRTFKFFDFKVNITGVDISQKMIKAASKDFDKEELVKKLIISPAEKLPFEDSKFDYLASFGTFDCTNQNLVLPEMLRVVKPEVCCVFRKNYCYKFEDQKAYAAEIGASSMATRILSPFTKKVVNQLISGGNLIKEELFFLNRGDTTDLNYKNKNPGQFYEYTIYVNKGQRLWKIQ